MKKLIVICVLFIISACTKNSSDSVFIRIQNNTTVNFKAIIVMNKVYKNVSVSEVTSYQSFENILSLPFARLVSNNNDTTYAGNIYIDWYSYLDKGKYTLKIFKDTSTATDFNCEYIKN